MKSDCLLERRAQIMKKIKRIIGLVIASGIGAALLNFLQKEKSNKEKELESTATLPPLSVPLPPEEAVVQEWTKLLRSDAKVYTGMFNGLQRVVDGSSKKPEKVIREWCARTSYKWPEISVINLCQKYLMPDAEKADPDGCAKWSKLLLEAAKNAGITSEEKEEIVLNDTTVMAYTEWDGQELYPESSVKVITPAWYQNGRVIEQGIASLTTSVSKD